MSTAHSPLRQLQAEADRIAKKLKAMERGDPDDAPDPLGKVAAARTRESITIGLVMDDKILQMEIPWATIAATSEAGMAAFILKHMRETRNQAH